MTPEIAARENAAAKKRWDAPRSVVTFRARQKATPEEVEAWFSSPPRVRMQAIAEHVAERSLVSVEELRGDATTPEVSEARAYAYYLCEQDKITLAAMGRFFGGRSHSTVQNALHQLHRKAREAAQFENLPEEVDA